jgi:hypothetical protein
MTVEINWRNETQVKTTSEMWAWLLDQEAAANEFAKPHKAQLEKMFAELVFVVEDDVPMDDWKPAYDVTVNYQVVPNDPF